MNENQLSVSAIIKGLGIYIIASIAYSISSTIDTLSSLVTDGIGFITILGVVAALAVIYGLYLYYSGLQQLASALDRVGAAAAKNLSYGAMLMMIAALFGAIGLFIPIIGSIIAAPFLIAAFVLNIIGYSNLQKSESFNALGKEGAKQLFMGFVFAIIAVCVGWIPLMGWVAAFVLNILYWVYLFKGWGKIRTSMAQ